MNKNRVFTENLKTAYGKHTVSKDSSGSIIEQLRVLFVVSLVVREAFEAGLALDRLDWRVVWCGAIRFGPLRLVVQD